MFGEKKSDIFDIIPQEFLPLTYLIDKGDLESAKEKGKGLGFPLIVKPNIGERGAWVRKIDKLGELEAYCKECPVDFLIQELVDYPIELGVFYVRFPDNEKGHVTSIVRKNFLSVKGDGNHSIIELLSKNIRASLTADLESDHLKKVGNNVPAKGEEVLIEPIGNHCRGTQFLNDNSQIDVALSEAIDQLAKQIPELYFGRFDLRCQSYDDLKRLENFKILELNGAGSEPGHIYQPGYSLFRAYQDIFWHLKVLADISEQNKLNGVPYCSFSDGIKKWKDHRQYNRLLST